MKNRKWLLASFGFLLLVIVVLALLEDTAQIEQKHTAQYLPPISVVTSQPQDNSGLIQVFAEVKPRWATTIKAQVSGEIVQVSDKALAGESVTKGELLMRIEDSAYKANLDEAERILSEVKLKLLQEQKKSTQAGKDWQRSGISTAPSDLALNIPQLDLAKKSVTAAQSHLKAARNNHAYTRIKAPFSGYVTARYVSIGQAVTEGEELLHIVHDAQLEIAVALSTQQWGMLAENWYNRMASIRSTSSVELCQAQIKRGGGYLDAETRQYTLFLEIDSKSSNKVLAGDFVRVNLPGRIARNSLAVPESTLTRDGFIWYLDDEDRLRRFAARVLFHQDDQIIIETPSSEMIGKHYPSTWRFATTPLASFLAGNRVKPVAIEKV